MQKELKGKNALITGGSRGIGRAIALKLAGMGANVAVNFSSGKSGKEADSVVAEALKNGVKAFKVRADVSESSDVKKMVEAVLRRFGSVDILVNNAGVFTPKIGAKVWEVGEEEWDRVFAVNAKGTFLVCREVARHMAERKSGHIVNVASIVGLIGSVSGIEYGASKGAVVAFTYSLAGQLGPYGVIVNAVAPSYVKTELVKGVGEERVKQIVKETPIPRLAEPEDIADAVAFLATTKFVSGHVLVVDGGRIKR